MQAKASIISFFFMHEHVNTKIPIIGNAGSCWFTFMIDSSPSIFRFDIA